MVCNEVGKCAEHPVDVAENRGVAQENKTEADVLHCGHAQHPNIPAADEGFVDGHEKTDQENNLSDLYRDGHDIRAINPVKCRLKKLFVIEHR